jgi:glutaredoxin-like YruB-family protein
MVTIYTTPTCVYCKATKKFLGDNDVQFAEKNVASDEAARTEMIEKSGQLGVPVIEVKDQVVIGFNKKRLAELLELPLEK